MAAKTTGRTKVTGKGVSAKPATRAGARPAAKAAGKASGKTPPKATAKTAAKAPPRSAPKQVAKPAAKAAPKPVPKKAAQPNPAPKAAAVKRDPAPKTQTQTPKPAAPAAKATEAKPPPVAAAPAPPAAPVAAPLPAPAPVPPAKAVAPKKPASVKPPVAANANAANADPPAAPMQPEFAVGDHVVYPTHGVGRVTGIVTEEIAGYRLDLIVVEFEENRMVLRVPVAKTKTAGLRKLSSRKAIELALSTLKGRARVKRTMWSRRAQEYEAKINSGDPIAIAEVVRDLHRNAGQPDQSFSERQIYEQAMDRLAAELAAIEQVDKPTAAAKLATMLKAA
jgi:CarD family transcriptional regulator